MEVVEPIPTVALIELVEFYLRLITSTEVLIILLNTNDKSGGAYYIKPYLKLVSTAGAGVGAGRSAITFTLSYSIMTSLPEIT